MNDDELETLFNSLSDDDWFIIEEIDINDCELRLAVRAHHHQKHRLIRWLNPHRRWSSLRWMV